MTAPAVLRERVARWFGLSVNRRILAAILVVGGWTVVVKVAAVLKELVIASRFGTGDAIDAFLIAFLVPSLVASIVAGSFNVAFTPAYVEIRESRGAPAAQRLFRGALAGGIALVLALSGLLLAGMPVVLHFLGGDFSPEKLGLTRSLFVLLVPTMLLSALATMWSAALNAEGRFAWAALAPLSVPLLIVATLLGAGSRWGVYALAWGTLLGYAAQCCVLAVAMAGRGLPLLPQWTGVTPELRRVGFQYLPMVAGAALASGSWAIGQAMAATLPPGSVAALNYGNRVVVGMTDIGSLAIATAVLPHFSLMVARQEWAAIHRTVRVYARLLALVACSATVVVILLSTAIVRVLFERGAFTATDTQLVSAIQVFYVLQVPFVVVGMLLVRLISSLKKNQILLLGAAITLPLNVVLNLLFMRWLGVAGVAVSTSVVFAVSCGFHALMLHNALRAAENRFFSAEPDWGRTRGQGS